MIVICSYCRETIRKCEPFDSDSISHGICRDCYQYFSDQWDGMKLGEYLDRFEQPCIAVDEDGRVIAGNRAVDKIVNKTMDQYQGLMAGDMMECQFARLPEGCGNTIHCHTCTIRIAITKTMTTGEDQINIPAFLTRDNGVFDMKISTIKEKNFVRIVIRQMDFVPNKSTEIAVT